MKFDGAVPFGGFSTMPVISKVGAEILALGDDAILMGVFLGHLLDGDDIAAMLVIGLDALLRGSAFRRRPAG